MGRLETARTRTRTPEPRNSQKRQSPASNEHIITYRLNDRMVYVVAASSFEEAVGFAKEVFPEDLADVHPERIRFAIRTSAPEGVRQSVQIGPMAWNAISSTLAKYEIVDVDVLPETLPHYQQYLDVPPNVKQLSRSPSPSPTKSRSSSPLPFAELGEKAKSFLGHIIP